MSHPGNLPELFEHMRFYEPKACEGYAAWFQEAIERESRAQARIEALEAALRGLLAAKDRPPFSAEAIEDNRAAWDAARSALEKQP